MRSGRFGKFLNWLKCNRNVCRILDPAALPDLGEDSAAATADHQLAVGANDRRSTKLRRGRQLTAATAASLGSVLRDRARRWRALRSGFLACAAVPVAAAAIPRARFEAQSMTAVAVVVSRSASRQPLATALITTR